MRLKLVSLSIVTVLLCGGCLDIVIQPEGRLWVRTQLRTYDELHGEEVVLDPFRSVTGWLVESYPWTNSSWTGTTFAKTTGSDSMAYTDNRRLPALWDFEFEDGPCEGLDLSAINAINNGIVRMECRIYTGTDNSEYTVEGASGGGYTNDGDLVYMPTDAGCCLYQDQQLEIGEALTSPNGRYVLLFQNDGNLVLHDVLTPSIVWQSDTPGDGGEFVYMQSDGNLVILNGSWSPIWASGTDGNAAAWLELQNDGNLVIYNSSHAAVWDVW